MTKARNVATYVRQYVRDRMDFVDLAEAQFLWHHEPDEDGRWLDECFVVLPHITDVKEIEHLRLNELACSTGVDTEGWPKAPSNNPGLLLGQIISMGWLSDEERVTAIAELAKVRELDWAREVLRGMAYECGAFTGEEDENPLWKPIDCIDKVDAFRNAILASMD